MAPDNNQYNLASGLPFRYLFSHVSQSLQIAAARCVTPLLWLERWIDSDADFQNNGQAPMQWEILLGKKNPNCNFAFFVTFTICTGRRWVIFTIFLI